MGAQAAQALRPGDSLGRYRVLDQIGRGGMGVVYRGVDSRFGREVAIKAIEGSIATDPLVRRRFLLETQNAPRVVHPFVATVFDVLDRPTGPLLVMEYVSGRRFDEVIKEAPLPLEKVRRYAMEIAEALSAIHQAGMVHRDLKPANVVITTQDHVKVMDFGVAMRTSSFDRTQLPTTDHTERPTEAGNVVGTLVYMAPEQLRGIEPDGRADLFSLGVVLWEALTGKHPFIGATAEETVGAILHEPPGGDEDDTRVSDAGPLGEIALQLLEKDPGRRIQTADELAGRLRAIADSRPEPSWTSRRVVAASSAAILTAGAVLVAMLAFRLPSETPRIAVRPVVAVLPFEGPASTGIDGERGRMIADLLAATLGETPNVRPLDPARVDEALSVLPPNASRMERVSRLARAAKPTWIVAGTLYSEGADLVAAVQVYDSDASEIRGSLQSRGRRASDLAIALAPRVRDMTGAPALAGFGGFARADVARTVSTDDEAQALLLRARRMASERDYAKAIGLLEQALERDTRFVDAQVLLADVLDRAGYERRARETIQAARRSIAARRLPEGSRQVLVADVVHARCLDSERLPDALTRLAEAYPDDSGLAADLAFALRRSGRSEDALVWAERSVAIDSLDGRGRMARALALQSVGRETEAREEIDEAVRLARDLDLPGLLAETVETRAFLSFLSGRIDDARADYVEAQRLFEKAGLPVRALVDVQSEADMDLAAWRLATAEPLYQRAVDGLNAAGHYSRVVSTLAGLGGVLLRQGRLTEAESRLREAVDDARKLGNDRLLAVPLSNLAVLLNETGRWTEARGACQEVLAVATASANPGPRCTSEVNLAWADYGEGRIRESLVRLEALVDGAGGRDCTPDRIGSALGYLAWFRGRTEDVVGAISAYDRASTTLQGGRHDLEIAFILADRAAFLAPLGDIAGARTDIARAETLVAGEAMTPPQLEDALRHAKGALAAAGREWRRAATIAKPGPRSFGVVVAALDLLRSEALLRSGDPSAAAEVARQVALRPASTAADRAAARLMLALALSGRGDRPGAAREARQALHEAERLGMPLAAARAASIVASLEPDAKDAADLRAIGGQRLSRFLETIPAERLEFVRAREDVADVLRILGEKRAS